MKLRSVLDTIPQRSYNCLGVANRRQKKTNSQEFCLFIRNYFFKLTKKTWFPASRGLSRRGKNESPLRLVLFRVVNWRSTEKSWPEPIKNGDRHSCSSLNHGNKRKRKIGNLAQILRYFCYEFLYIVRRTQLTAVNTAELNYALYKIEVCWSSNWEISVKWSPGEWNDTKKTQHDCSSAKVTDELQHVYNKHTKEAHLSLTEWPSPLATFFEVWTQYL